MPELAFRDGVMDRIRVRESRFDEKAFLFVLAPIDAEFVSPQCSSTLRASTP